MYINALKKLWDKFNELETWNISWKRNLFLLIYEHKVIIFKKIEEFFQISIIYKINWLIYKFLVGF